MDDLKTLLYQVVASGLKQKSLTTCSRWSCANRIMGQPYPGNFSFEHHPWLKEIHDCKNELIVGEKSAQMGYTETALNKVFYKIGVERVDCLYVLPSKVPDATDFSSSRFDVALELSSALNELFSDVKNVGHKRAGTANLYVRGSKARGGLKSIPVGFIVFDEVDEMEQDNIPLALERSSGQRTKQALMISTPTVDDFGIDKYYKMSTQEHFFFTCPSCNRQTELIFPDCLVIPVEEITDPRIKDSHIICKECKTKLHHEAKSEFLADGIWVPQYGDRDIRGFQINQLYSSTVTPKDLAISYLKSLNSPADEQEFFNSKLGKTHIVDGAKVTDVDISNCIGPHTIGPLKDMRLITMGIDVGRWLHVEVDEWILDQHTFTSDTNAASIVRVINQQKVEHFEQLDEIFVKYGCVYAVIDAAPERRKSFEFTQRLFGRASMCFYGVGVKGKALNISPEGAAEPTVTVDRTSWLDLSMGRFRTKRIILPKDTKYEYKTHLKNLVRIYDKDEEDNPVGKWVKTGEDHFAHARNYAEIALPLALTLGFASTIKKSVL